MLPISAWNALFFCFRSNPASIYKCYDFISTMAVKMKPFVFYIDCFGKRVAILLYRSLSRRLYRILNKAIGYFAGFPDLRITIIFALLFLSESLIPDKN